MSDTPAIELNEVGKRFRVRDTATRTVKSMVLDSLRGGRQRKDFWALKDVDFTVHPGETLGIIGANGAGKSTLLSLVAGTMQPTCGEVITRGTLSSLLELGAGFHPDLTGRENVFLYGAIMGLSKARMKERFDAIVDFAGIAEHIDQPVKHYSSGMYVRLGFAVAVEVNPDILLVDEVLAVGDVTFQRKCLEKMKLFKEQGKTLLIVSHDLPTIQRVSDRILILNNGTVQGLGDPGAMIGRYQTSQGEEGARALGKEWGTGELTIDGVEFSDENQQPLEQIVWGGELRVRINYTAHTRIPDPVFGFALSDAEGTLIYGSNTQIGGISIPEVEGPGSLQFSLKPLYLAGGSFLFSFSAHSSDHKTNYHRLDHQFVLPAQAREAGSGPCCFPCTWKI